MPNNRKIKKLRETQLSFNCQKGANLREVLLIATDFNYAKSRCSKRPKKELGFATDKKPFEDNQICDR